jgi:restriction endonuclease S subunit
LELKRRKETRYARPRYPLAMVGALAEFIQYGISERANTDGAGVPMIRMNNLQPLGWDFSDLKHIELDGVALRKYRLEPGDILFNRTNSKELVGKSEVFNEPGDWVFASYLIRVRLDRRKALPEFVSAFLNTEAGRMQIDQVSRQIAGMSNVNAEELRELEVPLPPDLARQSTLISELNSAVAQRDKHLREAEALIGSLDELVTSGLKLPAPNSIPTGGYAALRSAVRSLSNLSADYHHPERIRALRLISSVPHDTLSALVTFERSILREPGAAKYLGLASVASNSGQLTNAVETAAGQCFKFQAGDVLYARLRPYLNKVWAATFDGVCSTEFHVMRTKNAHFLRPEYLAVVMRTGLIVAQTKHMMTGNTHPRIANEDVVNLVIPLADLNVQDRIVAAAREREAEANRLREEAHTIWQAARLRFEEQLLNEVA